MPERPCAPQLSNLEALSGYLFGSAREGLPIARSFQSEVNCSPPILLCTVMVELLFCFFPHQNYATPPLALKTAWAADCRAQAGKLHLIRSEMSEAGESSVLAALEKRGPTCDDFPTSDRWWAAALRSCTRLWRSTGSGCAPTAASSSPTTGAAQLYMLYSNTDCQTD